MLISIFLTLRYHNLYFFVIMRRPLLIFIAALPMLSSQCFTDGHFPYLIWLNPEPLPAFQEFSCSTDSLAEHGQKLGSRSLA